MRVFRGQCPVIGQRFNFTADITHSQSKTINTDSYYTSRKDIDSSGFGLSIDQIIFDSNRTKNAVSASKSKVFSSRKLLDNLEQDILFNAASAYLTVRRDVLVARFSLRNLEFLDEELRSTKARFELGENTRTDVAQTESRRAAAIGRLSAAQAALKTGKARYLEIIGRDPENLESVEGVINFLPKTYDDALELGVSNHPAIMATLHKLNQAEFDVNAAESEFLPLLSLSGSVKKDYNRFSANRVVNSVSMTARLNVPIYQGGSASALVRQRKEKLGQAQMDLDNVRRRIRSAIIAAFSQNEASKASLVAGNEQLRAAKLALEGVMEERNLGQRTIP